MRDFSTIQNTDYDLIIIGGGVNGAATARDAALRGIKTILLEKGDYAGGTSSWSTRLVHGGLRYLEYFEFSLVRESLREREVLLRTAPHLVSPLMLTVPVYGDRSRPYWKISAGMLLYDLFSFDKTLPSHRMLPKEKFHQLFRDLDQEGLKGGAQYYDGQAVYAERLCLENIIAAEEAGATCLNYAEVTGLVRDRDQITQLECEDQLTGESFTVQGSKQAVIINTSGPWVDQVCQRGETNQKSAPIGEKPKIGGTKGSHIVVPPFSGAPDTALYVEAKSDGRPFFIVPWLGLYLIGTTDLPFKGSLDQVKADNDEIDYLLRETNLIIPSAQLTRDDVTFTYSGVRPLPYAEGQKPGSVTRKHIIHDHGSEGVKNLISLIGGKLTTFRHTAEELVDLVGKKQKRNLPACPTLKTPFPGAIVKSDQRMTAAIQTYRDRVPLKTLDHLFTLYGARAVSVLKLIDESPELAEAITPELPDIKAQIVYAVRYESAQTLVDILRRRTTIAMECNYGLDVLSVVGEVLQTHCGWSQTQRDRATEDYHAYMEGNCIPDYVLTPKKRATATR
ncbi:Glycerol-3-phosphate dehydrogenase [Halothece sp. PCC 7418]|uniref:glycerol-3-phosphate dehydrogenase n=1 Tax=Halothece sp. (strain PCC 7418) TaxID=65093 RepID=UPI0002A07309|nr:glycerol-3-phosphate dehydrogenase [Halothece sp. PCC 7418]AFZ44232.1 Glycerol-3-phosphate dehydrogenase [Halothece sp. PCC 7418]